MSTESRDRDQGLWEPCAEGELQQLVGRLAAQRRHRQLTKVGQWMVGATLTVVLFVVGGFAVHHFSQYHYGGIACSDVVVQLAAYRAGELNSKLTEQIRVHLEQCPACGPFYRKMISEKVAPAETKNIRGRGAPAMSVVAAWIYVPSR